MGGAQAALAQAHTLKGVPGNLGLTPMYELTCRAAEVLRVGSFAGVPQDYRQLMEQREKLAAILRGAF